MRGSPAGSAEVVHGGGGPQHRERGSACMCGAGWGGARKGGLQQEGWPSRAWEAGWGEAQPRGPASKQLQRHCLTRGPQAASCPRRRGCSARWEGGSSARQAQPWNSRAGPAEGGSAASVASQPLQQSTAWSHAAADSAASGAAGRAHPRRRRRSDAGLPRCCCPRPLRGGGPC